MLLILQIQAKLDNADLLLNDLGMGYTETQQRLLSPDTKDVFELVKRLQHLKKDLQRGRNEHASLCEARLRVRFFIAKIKIRYFTTTSAYNIHIQCITNINTHESLHSANTHRQYIFYL